MLGAISSTLIITFQQILADESESSKHPEHSRRINRNGFNSQTSVPLTEIIGTEPPILIKLLHF
jgi:hypothetical protein